MIFRHASAAAAIFVATAPCLAIEVEEIRDPRPGAWVADLAAVLPPDREDWVNRLAAAVRSAGDGELAVATVPTVGGRDPRRFATELFNHWGIGGADRDDGVLLFVAFEDRAAELILGEGVDDAANVRHAERIMQEVIVPKFRAGDPAAAISAGAEAAAERILNHDRPTAARPAPAATTPRPTATLPPVERDLPPVERGLPPVEREASSAAAPTAVAPAVPGPRTHTTRQGGGIAWLFLVLPAAAIGLFGGAVLLLLVKIVRVFSGPRRCPECGGEMDQLDEAGDDAHLTATERTEERLGSVDHQVWRCPRDGRTLKIARGRWFTGYAHCPACRAKSYSSESQTLRQATYDAPGLVRIDSRCAHCGHADVTTRTTPVRQRPNTGARRRRRMGGLGAIGSSRGGVSFGGSFGSRSRRSGFGGGRSSGRGASGRW